MKSPWMFRIAICFAIMCLLRSSAIAQLEKAKPIESDSVSTSETSTKFIRLSKENDQPKSLDTAVTSYRADSPEGVTVDLIGAVHVGERSYYSKLNKQFDQYDVLLYELVAPEGTVIPKGGHREGTNPVAFLQDSMKTFLGLESQLELVDYTKANFVRADMTPEQIGEKMEQRGDTALTVALSAFADIMREQNLAAKRLEGIENPLEDLGIFDLLEDPVKAKQVLAWQFTESGMLDQGLGKTLNQMLIVDRNAEALKQLQKQIAAGKKKIGIFYGAAHLPDFEKHLISDFGLKRSNQEWIAAWDLTRSSRKPTPNPLKLLESFFDPQ
jgi:hypothetical protein